MELFITSSLPSTSFTSDVSVASLASSKARHHQDFIKFMQQATAMNVELVAITWDPALEKRFNRGGGTGTVSTSGVNAELAFSYKRFKRKNDSGLVSEEQFRRLQYEAITNELAVLASPAMRNHDNIARLAGVCFELVDGGADVWPVLILFTANSGELTRVMSSNDEKGARMPEKLLLPICGEAAKGLETLHQNGVFHCDVNPRNILVWLDTSRSGMGVSGMAVLLADFGHSKFGSPDDLVRLPRTEPWDAPEWHSREFRIGDGDGLRRMDMYSFGLVCLWLFFRKAPLSGLGFPLATATVESAFLARDRAALDLVQVRKKQGNSILDWAIQLVRGSGLGAEAKSRLEKVFSLSLEAEPARRASSMAELMRVLLDPAQQQRAQYAAIEPTGVVVPDWHGTLNAAQLLANMEVCDYRVHRFLTKSMREMAAMEDDGCERCKENAAFQFAVCRSVGFGLDPTDPMDDEDDVINDMLRSAGKTAGDLAEAVESLKSFKPDLMYNPADTLAMLGYHVEVGAQYEADGILDDAVRHFQRTVSKRERSLGSEHFSTVRLKITLAGLLRRAGRVTEAMHVAQETTRMAGAAVTDKIAVNTLMARLLADLDDVESAEETMRALLAWYDHELDRVGLGRLGVQRDLILLLLGRWTAVDDGGGGGAQVDETDEALLKEALKLAIRLADECVAGLGLDHEGTRDAYRCLAAAYDASGMLGDAIRADEQIEKLVERPSAVRVLKRDVVRDTASLGVRYFRRGNLERSRKCYDKVMQLVEGDPGLTSAAVKAANSVLVTLLRRGDDNEQAAVMLEHLLERSLSVLGVYAGATVSVMASLAGVYSTLGRLDDAVELGRRVVSARRRTLGDAAPHTIQSMGDLRHALLQKREFREAAEVAAQELARLREWYDADVAAGADHQPDRLVHDIETIGRAFEEFGAWEEAIPFQEEELTLRRAASFTGTGGDGFEDAVGGGAAGGDGRLLSALARAAGSRLHVGQPGAARELWAEFVRLLPLSLSSDTNTKLPEEEICIAGAVLLGDMVRLAEICLEKEEEKCIGEVVGGVLSSVSDLMSRGGVTADRKLLAALETVRGEYLKRTG